MPAPQKLTLGKETSRPDILLAMARRPQSSVVIAGSSDFRLHALDLQDPSAKPQVFDEAHHGYVTGVCWTAAGQVVSGAYDGRLIWWDADTGKATRQQDAHAKWIRGVTATPDGAQVLSVADDMVCRVWDAASGELRRELTGHAQQTPQHFPSMLYCVAVSPDGALAATGDRLGKAMVWELATGNRLAEVEAPIMYTWDGRQRIHSIGGVRSLAFSPDSKLLALGGIGTIDNIDHLGALARVEVFDWRRQERTHEFKGDTHKGLVERLIFSPDGGSLCAVGGDNGGFLQLLDMEKSSVRFQDKSPMHIHDAAFDESFETLYAVGHHKAAAWSASS